MERTTGAAGAMRVGPLARRLLARRRRWLRWAAAILAVLTVLSAVAQLRHRSVPRRAAAPAAEAHHGPVAAPRFYGVAAEVPPGMRAVNLTVPAAAAFQGRLAPRSQVDLLAAFDTGQDRVVQRVLTSGLVLSAAPRSAGGAGASFSAPEGRFATAPAVELSVAIPAAREREVVMAQAFGRVFVAVQPAAEGPAASGAVFAPQACPAPAAPAGAAAGPAKSGEPLVLRRYLGLPALPAGPPAAASGQAALLPALFAARGMLSPMPDAARDAARPAAVRHGGVTVEVIEGTARSVAEVAP